MDDPRRLGPVAHLEVAGCIAAGDVGIGGRPKENNPHEAWKTFVYLDSTSKTNHDVYPLDVLDELAKAFLNMGQQYQGFMNHIWALRLKRINEFGSPNEKFYAQAGLLRYLRNNHRLEEDGELVKSIKDWSSKYLPPESIHLILYQEGMIFHDKGLFDQAKKIFKEGLKGKNSFKNYYLRLTLPVYRIKRRALNVTASLSLYSLLYR